MIRSGFRGPRLVLIASCLTMLSVGENSTAIMAALPAMTSELRLGPATVEWIVNAYLLASAVFIILGGEAADQFGARRSSAAGIALFALASLIIAVAADGAVVVGARALQGFGAALAVPGTLAAVSEDAPESDRARAIGAWTGFLMLGFSIGPLVGAITHYAGWRMNFWLNVLVMLPAGLALWLHPGTGDRQTNRVDWLGLALLAVFMVTLISGLHALPAARSEPAAAIVPLMLAAIAFAALLRVETRHHRPLLDFGLFQIKNFALACMLAFLLMFDIMTLLLYYNLFAQAPEGLGRTPVEAGLSLMPLSVALFGFARAAPGLAVAVGVRRRMMVGGSLLLALGCAIAWASLAGAGFAVLMIGLFAAGAGIALPYASAPRIGLAALSEAQTGKGSGVLNSCSFLGGTVGVTAGGIVFGVTGFGGVLVLIGLSALIGAGLALRLQSV
jgi:MFS family permease